MNILQRVTTAQANEALRRVRFNFSRDVDVRDDYSGRFMYGQNCIGVTGTIGDATIFIMQLVNVIVEAEVEAGDISADDRDEQQDRKDEIFIEIMDVTRWDNMGTSMIWYWPGLYVADPDDEV